MMRCPISCSVSDSVSESRNSSERVTDSFVNSKIDFSPTVTASTSGFRRAPLQTGHGRNDMYSSMRSRCCDESVSLYRRSRLETMPSKASVYCRRRPIRLRYWT